MSFNQFLVLILLINFSMSLFFLLKTASLSSKMLVTMLFSTIGVASLLLLYGCTNSTLFLDIALVFVLLSSSTAIIFAKRLRSCGQFGDGDE
ncbi:MAG: monovalent cation/H+ antiporter complex subunit F [Campylobacterota bacterium]